jgi:putative transposase
MATRRFPFLERMFADAGYQGPRVAAAAPRPVEIIKRTDAGFVVQPKRWVIERHLRLGLHQPLTCP